MGAGMGMAMAEQMMMGPWGRRGPQTSEQALSSAPPPVPSAPVEKVWHVAIKGKATGPYSRAELARQVEEGKMKRDTVVWTVGLDGWKTAAELDSAIIVAIPNRLSARADGVAKPFANWIFARR